MRMKGINYMLILLFVNSALVKAQITVGDSVSSNIFFQSLNNKYVGCSSYCGPSHMSQAADSLDVDQDGVPDLKFIQYNVSSPGGCAISERLELLNSGIQIAVIQSSYTYVDSLSKGTLVDNSKNWNYSAFKYFHSFSNTMGSSSAYGAFSSVKRCFGFRVNQATDTLYGWFQVSMDGLWNNMQGMYIYSYAITKPANGIETISSPGIKIYPNPASNVICVEGNDISEILLTNSLGDKIIHTGSKTLDVSNLPGGIYFLQVKSLEATLTKKLIIQH